MASVAAETTTGEAQLYERNADAVFRYCLRMLRSREDAEDATQTIFFQALRAMRRGVEPAYEQAWLLAIAQNECKSRFRAGSRRRRLELAQDPQVLAEIAEAAPAGDDRLVGVEQALGRLPETQRRALLLREWQGRSYAEIARELGTTLPAVEALLFRARKGLVRELGEDGKTRKHALDVASLLGALKSLLGGGAAVKLAAAGVAAVATVGTVAVASVERSPEPARAPVRAEERVQVKPAVKSPVVRLAPAVAKRRSAPTGTSSKNAPAAKAPVTATGAPAAAADEPQATAPPETAPAIPGAPPVAPPPAPSTPALPSVPAPETPVATPPAPVVQVPQPQLPVPAPTLPQVPAVPLPDVPVEVPAVPLPEVPKVLP